MTYKILVVDDEPANTRMLERIFRDQYEVISVQSGTDGLEALNVHDIALIISDQRMPGMTGVEFLKRSAELRPNCVRIILTGYTDASDLVDALNSGVVYKYVTKPWVNADLLLTVKRGLSHHETMKAQHRLNLDNERLRERLSDTENSYIKLCFEILNLKNAAARERATRVQDLALLVGRGLYLDPASLDILSLAASMHAIGDLYIPNELHCRKDDLSESEQLLVDGMRERGLELLEGLSGAVEIIDSIRYAAEHFDGSGRPSGLANVQIPLSSRIISVVKAYDELVCPESGAKAFSIEKAMAELHARAGKQFDPLVVNAFCGLVVVPQMQRITPPASSVLMV